MIGESVERQIGEHVYTCTPFYGETAAGIFLELFEAIGEPLALIIDKSEIGISDMMSGALGGESRLAIAPAVQALMAKLPAEKSKGILKRLVSNISVIADGKNLRLGEAAAFNAHFQQRVMRLFELAAFSIEVNFVDFYDAAKEKLGAAKKAAQAKAATVESQSSSPQM